MTATLDASALVAYLLEEGGSGNVKEALAKGAAFPRAIDRGSWQCASKCCEVRKGF